LPALDLCGLGWTAELADAIDPRFTPGRVTAQHRGEFTVVTELGELRARLPGRLVHDGVSVAVGDWVALDDTLIQSVLPRRSVFERTAAGHETVSQVVAANVDVVFVVASLAGEANVRRIERFLTVAWESGATPVVVLTKLDLCPDPAPLLAEIAGSAVGAEVIAVSSVTGEGFDKLEEHLVPGRTVALLGYSGVGKSTIVNRLAGRELFRTGEVGEGDEGRLTTSHRELVVLPSGALVIDTPGMRELQLWDGDEGMSSSFADVEELAVDCRFRDCSHTREPDCAVLRAVDEGVLPLDRLRSYRKLERELRAMELRKNVRLRREEARKWRARNLAGRERANWKRRGSV
jgi:ribosome biogenesis GTPase